MEKTAYKAPHISKLTLGTVQLGMDYGIANKKGKPQKEESWALLRYALASGAITLDTARHYGSEEVIGESGLAGQFTIVSKFKLNEAELQSLELAVAAARKSVLSSCKALNISRLPVCLFHQDKDNPMSLVAKLLPPILTRLKEEGLIETGGISVYYPEELNEITDWESVQAVQVPMNVFDLRLLKNGLLQRLKQSGTAVFVRSVFLQGLLLMQPEDLPLNLIWAKKYLEQLNTLAMDAGMSLAQLAFAYVRDTDGVTSLVIGAENTDQVKQNTALLNGPALPAAIRSAIETLFSDVPEKLITPGLWSA